MGVCLSRNWVLVNPSLPPHHMLATLRRPAAGRWVGVGIHKSLTYVTSCIYIYIYYMYIHILYTNINIYIYIVYIYIVIQIYISIYIQIVHICSIYIQVYISVSLYICVYLYIYIYIERDTHFGDEAVDLVKSPYPHTCMYYIFIYMFFHLCK